MNLYVFDFDGTLFRKGPPAPEGEVPEEWFSTLDSITPPAIPFRPPAKHFIEPVVAEAKDAILDPFGYMVLLTGREPLFETRIKQILRQVGLTFNAYLFRPPFYPTLEFKVDALVPFLSHSSLQSIDLWEDTKENLMAQIQLCSKFAPTRGHLVYSWEIQ